MTVDKLNGDISLPPSLPGVCRGPGTTCKETVKVFSQRHLLTLGVEGAALHQRLSVPNTPPVEVLSKEMSIPVNVSVQQL